MKFSVGKDLGLSHSLYDLRRLWNTLRLKIEVTKLLLILKIVSVPLYTR